jgi:RNA-directed DNA polymerase
MDTKSISISVRKLQNRIVNAKKAGRVRMVKKLQKLLVKSFNARILAVKRVSENKGKKTAGVDGKLLDTNRKKDRCVEELKIDLSTYKSQPLKRIEIPKKNGKMRPLGIPTMFDRAVQALYKLTLEPIAEISADKNSYGFRAYRSTQDAMKQIWSCSCRKNSRQWVLEADIKGCFDNISHQWIYDNIPLDNRLLKQWLKSGFIKDDKLFPTNDGTPQGGIISPILANMVLDGIEEIVRNHNKVIQKTVKGVQLYRNTILFNFIRYADDFVVTGNNPKVLRTLQYDIEQFLNQRGLEFSKEKTHIINIYEGYDFLGFNFRKYPDGKLLVKPTKESIKAFKYKIKQIFKKYRASSLTVLIAKLNPVIRGWGNYYRFVNSKKIFSALDKYIWYKSLNWVKRVHKRRQTIKYYYKYFKPFQNYKIETLNDGDKSVFVLTSIPLAKHIKIRAEANPFDKIYDDYFLKKWIALKSRKVLAINT